MEYNDLQAEDVYPDSTAEQDQGGAYNPNAKANLETLLNRYMTEPSQYAVELAKARKAREKSLRELNSIYSQMGAQPANTPSKAEMYFRLAAAFGAPTKTGNFFESLGNAGHEMAGYQSDVRAAKAQQALNQLKAREGIQKLNVEASGDDITALQGLAGREQTGRDALIRELVKQGATGNRPLSTYGKTAIDEGFKQGTPEYQKRVRELAAQSGDAQAARLGVSLTDLQLRQAREARQSGEMNPTEQKLLVDTEDMMGSQNDTLGLIDRAIELSPKAFGSTVAEKVQRKTMEETSPNNERVIATRDLENILTNQALTSLRSTFGGNPTEGERGILLDIQGIGAKSPQERARILTRAREAVQKRIARSQSRIESIRSGGYRVRNPEAQ